MTAESCSANVEWRDAYMEGEMKIEMAAGWAKIVRNPNKARFPNVAEEKSTDIVKWEVPAQLIALSVSPGRTICIGGYEFARMTIKLSASVTSGDHIDQTLKYLNDSANEILAREANAVLHGLSQEDKREDVEIGVPPNRIYKVVAGAEYGLTLSQPNKGFGKSDVLIEVPVGDDESIDDVFASIQRWLQSVMAIEVEVLRGTGK